MDYPFRFYGRKPNLDLAPTYHHFSAQFERVPNDAELTALGELFERVLREAPVEPHGEWQWSDRFALFPVNERGDATSFNQLAGCLVWLDKK